MQRLRLYDLRLSRLPNAIGLCQGDVPGIASYVNSAQRRLLECKEAGNDGWWGTWAEIAYSISRTQPYLTVGRDVARVEYADVCQQPVSVVNQFGEYLRFGNGRLPKTFFPKCSMGIVQALTRNNTPTFVDKPAGTVMLRVYNSDATDDGKKILMGGLDANGKIIYCQSGLNRHTGEFVSFRAPFIDATNHFSAITAFQKDITEGTIEVHAVDLVTGDETLLVTMQPGETTASYRRYYFDSLPLNCCQGTPTTVTNVSITVIAKLELIPVVVDTDYCLIQNPEAIIAECQAIRYSEQDGEIAKRQSRERHNEAIGYLNGELNHYMGRQQPAINFAPFGTARLEKRNIGNMV